MNKDIKEMSGYDFIRGVKRGKGEMTIMTY